MMQLSGEKSLPVNLDTAPSRTSDEAIAEAYAYKSSVANFENDQGAKRRYEKMMDDGIALQIKEGKNKKA